MARTLRRTNRTPITTENSLARRVAQFVMLKRTIKEATQESNTLKTELLAEVEALGAPDEKGSQWLPLDQKIVVGDTEVSALKRERRNAQVFLEEDALALLKTLDYYDEAKVAELEENLNKIIEACDQPVLVYFSVTLDQDIVRVLNQTKGEDGEKIISDEVLDSLFEDNITWAFVPQK